MVTAAGDAVELLRNKVRASAQNRPGIYRMLGPSGVVLYVGKSKRVRTRLLSYFRAGREEKAWRIIRESHAIDWEYTPSEFASLLRELELIKSHRPQFNVQQKRDRLYSFLKMTGGAAPGLKVVRRVNEEPGSYFGPFRGGRRIAEAVKEVNDVLMLRDCRQSTPIQFADQRDLFGSSLTPHCPRFDLHRCAAPCAARCTEREYMQRVDQARGFLEGTEDAPLLALRRRMEDAASRMEFEHAASLRDRLARLERLQEEFVRLRETVETLSFLYAVPGTDGDHRIYAIRSGSIRGVYPAPRSARGRTRLLTSLERHYREAEPAGRIDSLTRADQVLLVAHWFRTRPEEMRRTYTEERWSDLPLRRRLEAEGMA